MRLRLAWVLAVAVPSSGCSYLFMGGRPEKLAAPQCRPGMDALPNMDATFASFLGPGAFGLAVGAGSLPGGFELRGIEAAGFVLVGGALAALHAVSAIRGFKALRRCEELRRQRALGAMPLSPSAVPTRLAPSQTGGLSWPRSARSRRRSSSPPPSR